MSDGAVARIWKRSRAAAVPVRLALIGIALAASYALIRSPAGEALDRFAYDTLFGARGRLSTPEDIVIVAIDEPSFDEINLQWPWPRGLHAQLIERVFEAGARAMAIDLLFTEPSVDAEDDALASVIEKYRRVVLASEISIVEQEEFGYAATKVIDPLPLLSRMKDRTPTGFVSFLLESDGSVKRVRLTQEGELSLSLQAARQFSGDERLGLERGGREVRYINFLGPPRTIKTISYFEALEPEKYLPPGYLEGKMLLLGFSTLSPATAGDQKDHFATPYTLWRGGYTAGVEIHAQTIANLLDDAFIEVIPPERSLLIGMIGGLLAGIVFFTVRLRPGVVLYLVLLLGGAAASFLLFSDAATYASPVNLLVPVTATYLLSPFFLYFYTYRQRNFIRKAFSTYLAPGLVQQLIENPDRLELGGEELNGSVLFLDLAGFTSFSENLPPQKLIEFVNRNLGAFAEIVLEHEGMIDKYIGDCIMAVWGVPIQRPDHALLACRAALAMKLKLEELVRVEREMSGVTISVRIGVNSGLMVAGNVGGGKQFNYTVLGNEVNLASRLEGINKYYGTQVIISESTAQLVEDRFLLRELDVIRVVGKQVPVTIYELLGDKEEASEELKLLDQLFQEGRQLYLERQWIDAAKRFSRVLDLFPDDSPSKHYEERCNEYQLWPPPDEWDGVYQMRSK